MTTRRQSTQRDERSYAERIHAAAEEVAAQAPPLSDRQIQVLRVLLRPRAGKRNAA